MKSFSLFIAEAKRSKIRQDSKTGDEDGVNTKNDTVGTVSITDDVVPDSWNNSPELRKRAVKKITALAGAIEKPHSSIKEGMTSTMGMARSTPVSMSSTPRNKAANAPSSAASLQRAADSRRQKLDTFAQKQKDLQTKNRETELKSREQKSNQNASNN